MIIYRVEHPNNQHGPYNIANLEYFGEVGHQVINDMGNDHRMDSENHPSMWRDVPVGKRISFDHYCAFDTFDKLLEWFEGYIDYLLNMGFKILEIEVPDNDAFISASSKQLFFRKENRKVLNILF